MTEQPDLSTLPNRMRYAATVLKEANRRRGSSLWHQMSFEHLERDADVWEDEDAAAAEEAAAREALVEHLARELGPIVWSPHPFESLSVPNQRFCRTHARRLIDAGWRIGDPK